MFCRYFTIFLFSICSVSFAAGSGPARREYEARIYNLDERNRYEEAISLSDEFANAMFAQSGAGLPFAQAISLKAYLLLKLGRLDQATALFEQALAVYRKNVQTSDPALARALGNLGVAYQQGGRHDEAGQLFKQSLEINDAALKPDDPEIATSLTNLAKIYERQDRAIEAEGLLRRALKIREKRFPKADPIIAASLQNLAGALSPQGRDAEAEPLLRRAIAIREASQPRFHPETAGAYQFLAVNLRRQMRFAESEARFLTALEIRKKSQPEGHPDIASNLKDFATLYIEQDRFEKAAPLLKQAIRMIEKSYSEDHHDLIELIELLAYVLDQRGDFAEALTYARRGSVLAARNATVTRASWLAFLNHVRITWHVYEAGQRKDVALLDEALAAAQRAELSATAASISSLAVRLAATDPALQEIVRERQDTEAAREQADRQLAALYVLPREARGDAGAKFRALLSQTHSRLEQLDKRIAADFPRYTSLVRPAPLGVSEIQALLRPDEALVNFLTGENETFVWAITGNRAIWDRVDLGRRELQQYEQTLRNGLQPGKFSDGNDQPYDLALAHRIYKMLFGSIEGAIQTKRYLMVASSGVLTSMPFQALVLSPPQPAPPKASEEGYRGANWFVRRFALSILPAVSNLKALRLAVQSRPERKPLIGFANPDFGNNRQASAARARSYTSYWKGAAADLDALRAGLAALPETEQELRAVARFAGARGEDLYFQSAASETAVKQAKLSDYRIIYFATHGLVAGEVGGLAEPALVLSLPQRASEFDDGLLTMSEVSKLRLDADWVVLSACNTAAGDKQGADALSGLTRAFFYAGARALLVSHWPVETNSGVSLTTGAFEAMRKNPAMGRAEALRQSMLALIEGSAQGSAHPAYWAPFFVAGEGSAGVSTTTDTERQASPRLQ